MNLLSRFLSSFISALPSGIPATLLIRYAWLQYCYDIKCKAINVVLMLTGVVLALWTLLVFALCLLEKQEPEGYDAWKRFRMNLLDVTPKILFHAAITGVMIYYCMNMVLSNLDTSDYKASGSLYLIAIFAVPVYELTRILERRKSIHPAYEENGVPVPWQIYVGMYVQTALLFGSWYGIMLLLLQHKTFVTGYISNASWHTYVVLGLMAGISFLLVKIVKKAESMLREKGIIHWDSSYF